jgi:lipid-A-disaccharide synthase
MNQSDQKKSILIIAGEASGDLHGGELIRFIKKKRPELEIFGIGGDEMEKQGMEIVYHVRDMSFLGFFEVIRHLPFIRRVFRKMKKFMKDRRPDLILLIDYPGFNLRFAAQARIMRTPVLYYISPQVWAWGKRRVKKIARIVDKMLVIFPFEVDLYEKAGVNVEFVGHPLIDAVKVNTSRKVFFKTLNLDPEKPTMGLLPGSRNQEISRLLPEMIAALHLLRKKQPDLQFLLGKSPTVSDEIYLPFLAPEPSIHSVRGHTYDIMSHSDMVLVASGTATLETAILQTPMVILYKMSTLSFFIGRLLVKVRQIGLANIVAGRKVVPELLQKQAKGIIIAKTAWQILNDEGQRDRIRQELSSVSRRLGEPGASERAANAVMAFLDKQDR